MDSEVGGKLRSLENFSKVFSLENLDLLDARWLGVTPDSTAPNVQIGRSNVLYRFSITVMADFGPIILRSCQNSAPIIEDDTITKYLGITFDKRPPM